MNSHIHTSVWMSTLASPPDQHTVTLHQDRMQTECEWEEEFERKEVQQDPRFDAYPYPSPISNSNNLPPGAITQGSLY